VDEQTLREMIQSVQDLYDGQGIFMQQYGFGLRPGLIVIDMAYGWTDPAYATGSARLDSAVEGIRQLLPLCRERDVPIVYTTSPYRKDDVDPMHRRGSDHRAWDEHACEIDVRLQPQKQDLVLYKEDASAFFGTHLASYLIEHGVDTLIVTGCSTSACVRATVTDARAYRFKPIVPRQCVQDRAAAAHEWNLFDINAKFGDVVEIGEVIDYLGQTTIRDAASQRNGESADHAS
jgi:maleamate amidohydrolase